MARVCLDKQRRELLVRLTELLAVIVTICCGVVLGVLFAIFGGELRLATISPAVIAVVLAAGLAHMPRRKNGGRLGYQTRSLRSP